ncbi:DUF3853 family protein [Phocaeicola plebeius]|uniref:DUF3853 family protein n=1 Tax=Phocaeicola plebeius TaxID=310297 RepID=UPI00307C84CB
MNDSILIKDLTIGELRNIISDFFDEKATEISGMTTDRPLDKRYVYGLAGLAQLLGCSKVTASRIKRSGKIDEAISQCGRKIIIDKNLALQLLNRANRSSHKKR